MFECDCKCHRICHICGSLFAGPNDYHVNCCDNVASGTVTPTIYTVPDRYKPWPGEKVDQS
jgi:hypothetical protein